MPVSEFSWYMDNAEYFYKTNVDKKIAYAKYSISYGIKFSTVVGNSNPDIGNKGALGTNAKDHGIIGNSNKKTGSDIIMSDVSILYDSGFYRYEDLAIDHLSKRNVNKFTTATGVGYSTDILKPLFILSKFFLEVKDHPQYLINNFITTGECYEFLSTIDKYSDINNTFINKIVSSRKYNNGKLIITKPVENKVYLSGLFSLLNETKLFDFHSSNYKQVLIVNPLYWECVEFIANNCSNINQTSILEYQDLYAYYCDINTGIQEIIPDINFIVSPPANSIASLYCYLFDIQNSTDLYTPFDWRLYFNVDCRGIYRELYPLERVIFAKMYTRNTQHGIDYKNISEYLCTFSINYSHTFQQTLNNGGNLMISAPFNSGYINASSLISSTVVVNTSDFDRNRIIFGAPGTGKSYTLNKEAEILIGSHTELANNFERVTFYSDYSYSNFVGTYKPVPIIDSAGNEAISYKYVPGPFMRILVKALKDCIKSRNNDSQEEVSYRPYLIVIEEINRANVSAVFGDIFQLLDRNTNHESEYSISTSDDIRRYLADELGLAIDDDLITNIKIPSNLFIWATMNSADQGVYPIDTAFKRRWNFKYIGINTDESLIDSVDIEIISGQIINWNKLRRAINKELLKYKLNEDKLMGSFFISKDILFITEPLTLNETFKRTFKDKVLSYLFEDAAKQKRSTLFEPCGEESNLYSAICEKFDSKGIEIFCENIQNDSK